MSNEVLERMTASPVVHRFRVLAGRTAFAMIPVLFSACSGLFDVENPGALSDEDLDEPHMIEALSNSTEGAISVALGSSITNGGLVVDEVIHVRSLSYSYLPVSEGYMDHENEILDGAYDQLSRARWVSDEMVRRLEAAVSEPGSHLGIARSHFFGGIAILILSDMFREVTFDNQPPVTPAQAIDSAIVRFKQAAAIAAAAGDTHLEAAAHGSLARAYRSMYFEELHHGSGEDRTLFQRAEAAAAEALSLDANFNMVVRYEPPGSGNGVYNVLNLGSPPNNRMGPAFLNKIDPVSGERDPRIEHSEQQGTSIHGDPIHVQLKYKSLGDDIPVSRAAEAELIIAEARLLDDDLDEAVKYINRVRARSALPEFSSTDSNEVRQQLLYERSVEFWLEGRRWPDHRYYGIVPDSWVDVNKTAGVHRRWIISRTERNANPYYR